jgi:hypothetical protein
MVQTAVIKDARVVRSGMVNSTRDDPGQRSAAHSTGEAVVHNKLSRYFQQKRLDTGLKSGQLARPAGRENACPLVARAGRRWRSRVDRVHFAT